MEGREVDVAEIAHVLDDVRREDDDDVLADLGEQVVEAVALLRDRGRRSARRR
jgi:hypothetical protein